MTPGSLIGKQYRLTRELGSGAMGVVWAAINEKTGREVALKLVLKSTEELRHRLQREARACGALQHRNIVDIYDVGQTDDGDPFLVMQLLHGETLSERLARQRRLDPPDAAAIARDVARALEAAHGANIIHRDLKPANIFLHTEAGSQGTVVKVLDFGVAKNLATSDGLTTVAGGMVGSPAYMSPEQSVGARSIDHRTDIWSLGVVLFEMLSGRRPFEGESAQIMVRIGTGEIPLVSRHVRRIDESFVELVSRCLERDPGKRFSTARELAERLDRQATSSAAKLAPSGPFEAREAPRNEPPSAPVPAFAPDPAARHAIGTIDPGTRSPRLPGLTPQMPGMPEEEGEGETKRLDPRVLGAMARQGPSFANAPKLDRPGSRSDISSAQAPLRPAMPGAPGTIPLSPQSEPNPRAPAPMAPPSPVYTAPEVPTTQPLHPPQYGPTPEVSAVPAVTERIHAATPAPAPTWQSAHASQAASFGAPDAQEQTTLEIQNPSASPRTGTVRIDPALIAHIPPPTAPPPSSSMGPLTVTPHQAEEPVALPIHRTGVYLAIGGGIAAIAAIAVVLVLTFGGGLKAPSPAAEVTTSAPMLTSSATASAPVAPIPSATAVQEDPPPSAPPPPAASASATTHRAPSRSGGTASPVPKKPPQGPKLPPLPGGKYNPGKP